MLFQIIQHEIMKTTLLLILTVFTLITRINAQNVSIPDYNFKTSLVSNAAINTNGDSEIQVSEANAYTGSIVLASLYSAVSDLTGLEAFTQLTELDMYAGSLTSIDLSQNTSLEVLRLYGFSNKPIIPLSALDLSNNTALLNLTVQLTSITSLDLTSNTLLTDLNLSGSTVSTLDVSNCSELSLADLTNCNLTALDLSANPKLTYLKCPGNQITSLDLSENSLLVHLNCSNNQLTSLDLTNGNNSILQPSFFNATSNPDLSCIAVSDVVWCTENISNNQAMTPLDSGTHYSFDCNQCYVTIPDANFKNCLLNTAAINLNGDNEIECAEAALAKNITCNYQNISDLTGIEAFTDLVTLRIDGNQISTVDLSNNTKLDWLDAPNNQLSSLDLSSNLSLRNIDCGNNLLTSLDLSLNTALSTIQCNDNNLSFLNVANGQNTLVNNNNFYVINNPDLTCIQVDDVAYSTTNWTNKDAVASYNTHCSVAVLVSSISVQGKSGVSTITTKEGSLLLAASVSPSNADDKTYTWSVVNGTGAASISGSVLTAISDGTVEVTATANDGSGVTGSITITISNQNASVGINELDYHEVEVYPNPVQNELFVDVESKQITEISILDYSGRVVKSIVNSTTNSIDVSGLTKGIYMLKVSTKTGVFTNHFVKE